MVKCLETLHNCSCSMRHFCGQTMALFVKKINLSNNMAQNLSYLKSMTFERPTVTVTTQPWVNTMCDDSQSVDQIGCLSVPQRVCLSIRSYVCLSVCLSIRWSVCPSDHLSVCLSVCPSSDPSVHHIICLSAWPSLASILYFIHFLSVYLFMQLAIFEDILLKFWIIISSRPT